MRMPDSTFYNGWFCAQNPILNIITNNLEGIFVDFVSLILYFLLQDFRPYIFMHLCKYWDIILKKQKYMLLENETVIL